MKLLAEEEIKIGVYICHCGINIGGIVSLPDLIEYSKTLPNVVLAKEYKFMCSDIGQNMIQEDIKNDLVNRVIVASCSPRMINHA